MVFLKDFSDCRLGNGVKFCARLLQAHSGLEPADHSDYRELGRPGVAQGKRHPKVIVQPKQIGDDEIGWEHSHNGISLAIQGHALAYHGRIAAKISLPQSVAQDHYRRSTWAVLLGKENSSDHGLSFQKCEKRGTGRAGIDSLCLAPAGEVGRRGDVGGNLSQRAALVPPGGEVLAG